MQPVSWSLSTMGTIQASREYEQPFIIYLRYCISTRLHGLDKELIPLSPSKPFHFDLSTCRISIWWSASGKWRVNYLWLLSVEICQFNYEWQTYLSKYRFFKSTVQTSSQPLTALAKLGCKHNDTAEYRSRRDLQPLGRLSTPRWVWRNQYFLLIQFSVKKYYPADIILSLL